MNQEHPNVLAFKAAVERADADALRALFAEHPELTEVVDQPWFAFGTPALVFLAKSEHREAVDVLLDAGADPNAMSDWRAGPYSALHGIVDSAEVDDALAEHLIRRGAKVDVHAAAGLGRVDELRRLLDDAPELVNAPGPDGAAPLHLARTVEVAALLLERGADPEQRCVDHRSTAIMWSTQRDPEVTRFLAEQGARPDLFTAAVLDDPEMAREILDRNPGAIAVRISFGRSHEHLGFGDKYLWALGFADRPIELARRRGHAAVFEFLYERSAPAVRLLMASRSGDVPRIAALLAEMPELLDSLTGSETCDLLCGAPEAVATLLEAGADPNVRDEQHGATPLHHAAWANEMERARVLLELGADPTVADTSFGSTPSGWAAHAGHEELAALLKPDPG